MNRRAISATGASADRCVRRQHADQERAMPLSRNVKTSILRRPTRNRRPADRRCDETHRERCEGGKRVGGRIRFGEEQLRQDRRRGYPVSGKIEPFKRGTGNTCSSPLDWPSACCRFARHERQHCGPMRFLASSIASPDCLCQGCFVEQFFQFQPAMSRVIN